MVVVYNNILVESKIQFVNDDDSSILFNYNDSFLSKQFVTVVTVDGSGLTCKNYEGFLSTRIEFDILVESTTSTGSTTVSDVIDTSKL